MKPGISPITGLMVFVIVLAACQSDQSSLPTYVPTKKPSATVRPVFRLPTLTSTQIVTPLPSETPRVTATMLAQPDVILSENFSGESSCLETFDNVHALGELASGEYVITVRGADEIINANCETLVVGDFVLEVDATVTSVDTEGSYYFGLLFRVAGDERYAFVIGSEGGYCSYYTKGGYVLSFTNSTDYPVQCWARIPEDVLTEGRQHLRVVAEDDRIDLYLNGVLLAVFRDGKLHEGWVGFVVATAGGGGVQITFDNLKISRLE